MKELQESSSNHRAQDLLLHLYFFLHTAYAEISIYLYFFQVTNEQLSSEVMQDFML